VAQSCALWFLERGRCPLGKGASFSLRMSDVAQDKRLAESDVESRVSVLATRRSQVENVGFTKTLVLS